MPEERFYDAVGRPRKLAQGAMTAIQREFRKGNLTTKELAERWGVSVSLILTICYHVPRGTGKRPKPQDKRPVVIPINKNAVTALNQGGTS
jgi:hypothetical protein